jgi:tetratricopeptide (TPR) repeat protein
MTMFKNWKQAASATALALTLAAGLMAPAMAAGADPAEAAAAALEADRQVVVRASAALNSGGYPAVEPHVGQLRLVLGRAPEGGTVSAEAAEVYGGAAMILTMEAIESRRFEDAVAYGTKGLALLPDSTVLLTETATAYSQLRRFDEGLALVDGWLAMHSASDPADRARVHRARGFALIELQRLDEAETAYREALKLEPNHQGAKDELAYIAQLRQGGEKQGIGVTTADKAATEGAKAIEK